MDELNASASDDKSVANTGIIARQSGEENRLEALLLDDSDSSQPFGAIAEQEVRVVGAGKNHFGTLLVLLLLCVILLGSGYYYLFRMPVPPPSELQPSLYVSPKLAVPARPSIDLSASVAASAADKLSSPDLTTVAAEKKELDNNTPAVTPQVAVPLFNVIIGPFIDDDELQQAINWLQELGFQPQIKPGRGPVTMLRLLKGVYPADEAHSYLAALRKVVKSAFLLPDGDKLAVYAGSFHQEKRARQLQDELAHEMIAVTLVESTITMNGSMLTALQADQQTAREVAAYISSLGLQTQLIEAK